MYFGLLMFVAEGMGVFQARFGKAGDIYPRVGSFIGGALVDNGEDVGILLIVLL